MVRHFEHGSGEPYAERVATRTTTLRWFACLLTAWFASACGSASVGTRPSETAGSTAAQLCASFHPPGLANAQPTLSISTTARAVTLGARLSLGHALHPWDQLPPGTLVADCVYDNNLTPQAISGAPTSICPGGQSLILQPSPVGYLIDAAGHSTPDVHPNPSPEPSFASLGHDSPTTA